MTTFTEVPEANRSPAAFVEVDASEAGAGGAGVDHVVLLGRIAAGGTAPADALVTVGTPSEAGGLFGARSQLAAMIRAFREANEQARITAIGIDGAGTDATGQFALAGAAAEDGALEVQVGDERIVVAVADGDAAADVATALRAALAAASTLPVTAGGTGGDVDLTAAWSGPTGNDIRLAVGDVPAGLTVGVTAMAGGATEASLATALASLETETRYDAFITGLNDDASLDALAAEVADRWLATRALDGHVFAARDDDLSGLLSYGPTRNDPEVTIMGTLQSTTPPWIWAAAVAGAAMGVSDPAAPRFGVDVPGVTPPPIAQRASHAQRNALLSAGITTHRVSGAGVILDRVITTYQRNDAGDPDAAWLDFTTRLTISHLRQSWQSRISSKYLSYKLANDGTSFDPGTKVLTPAVLRGEALAWALEQERAGLIEDVETFRRRLVALRDVADPNRVNALLTPDIVNKAVTIATRLAFKV